MKIIFLNLYSGKIERGAETQAHELAEQLKAFYEVEFIKGNSSSVSAHQFDGNIFQRWFNRKRFFIDKAGIEIFKFSLKNLFYILKAKPDWIVPMNGFWQVLLLKIFSIFGRYKILIVGHSGPGWDERFNLYLKPTVFIASTKPMFDWAKKTAPSTKVKLIPYGIDTDKFQNEYTSGEFDFLKNLEKPIILCPSALVPYKQVDLAILAISKLKKGSLLILGKGPLESKLKALGQKLLGEKRFHLTSVSYEQMLPIYKYIDLVTLPSNSQENSPMVFVESLAAGKNVVATDAPRVRWALGKSGFYVDPKDTKNYAKTLQLALNTKTNTQKDLEKFKWENVLKLFREIFETY